MHSQARPFVAPKARLSAVSGIAMALCLAAPTASHADRPVLVQAEAPVGVDAAALFDILRLPDMLAILQTEGQDYGQSLKDGMFAGSGGAAWSAKVSDIYDIGRMQSAFGDSFRVALGDDATAMAQAAAFFSSDLGIRILSFELDARRALLDEAAEDAAKLEWSRIEAEDGDRADLIRQFVEANDLIESNVMGALNANLAFFRGLSHGGALGPEMTEDEMLSSVWSQEAEVREQTTEWLFPYLTLAYAPLTDAELESYIAYSQSPAGQTLNAALFAAFAGVFDPISRALGAAAAIQMQGQDI